jgi:site-specific DNA-methyltransferase (adenine-specific)
LIRQTLGEYLVINRKNEALGAEKKFFTSVQQAKDYIENFDILETINNVGNDEVFTPVRVCNEMLDSLPKEVWTNPNYKWLNPTDKNGVFLREISLRLDLGLSGWETNVEKRRKHILQNMLFSIGLTRFTAQVSRRTVYYCSNAIKKFDGKIDDQGNSINGHAIGNGSWFSSEEGNILNPTSNHNFNKGKCDFCGVSKNSKYADVNQIEHYAYDFIHQKKIQEYLNLRFSGGKKVMKFDIIIGNPPYQLSDGGAKASAKPIYHLFINQALNLNPKYLCMIIPSRWMAGGKGLDEFRQQMLNDKRIEVFHDYLNHEDCFPNTKITGGVCYFLWNREHSGKCDFYSHLQNKEVVKTKRFLSNGKDAILIRDALQQQILLKVQQKNLESFSNLVSSRKPFGFAGDFVRNAEKYNFPKINKLSSGYYKILYFDSGKRLYEYLPQNYTIPNGEEYIGKWKVFINEAYGDGILGNPIPAKIIGLPQLGEPNDICTETFLVIGPFNSKRESEKIIDYMRTKFFRFMVGIKKISQHITKNVYEFVPLVRDLGIIDDPNLYKYFALDEEEIEYIEKLIQEVSW